MSFKDYYSNLGPAEKNIIRDYFVPKYIRNSSFYAKVADNTFTELEFERLELITGQIFERNA